jgi:hypothetical protein
VLLNADRRKGRFQISGNRTRNHPCFGVVPQPTTLQDRYKLKVLHTYQEVTGQGQLYSKKIYELWRKLLFIIPTSHYTRALSELEMLRSCINFNYVFYTNEASRTSQATFFDSVSGFWIFTRMMQSYRDGPMGTCNILHEVWNRKSTESLFILFLFQW